MFYFRDKSNLGWPIIRSFRVLCRYHLGTVSFGSLIVAMFTMLRKLIQTALEKALEDTRYNLVNTCLQIVLDKLDELLKYFARNAYIICAIYGWTFWKSAKRAFHVIKNNIFCIMAINTIGDYVLFFSKLTVVVIVCICAFFAMRVSFKIKSTNFCRVVYMVEF